MPINPQYQAADRKGINFDNFCTDPTLRHYRRARDFFHKSLPSRLDKDRTLPNKKTPDWDSPLTIPISLGAQPQQPTPVEEIVHQPNRALEIVEPLIIRQYFIPEQPRWIFRAPPYLTTKLPETSKVSDEYVEPPITLRRSTKTQQQQSSRLSERVPEVTDNNFKRPAVLHTKVKSNR